MTNAGCDESRKNLEKVVELIDAGQLDDAATMLDGLSSELVLRATYNCGQWTIKRMVDYRALLDLAAEWLRENGATVGRNLTLGAIALLPC